MYMLKRTYTCNCLGMKAKINSKPTEVRTKSKSSETLCCRLSRTVDIASSASMIVMRLCHDLRTPLHLMFFHLVSPFWRNFGCRWLDKPVLVVCRLVFLSCGNKKIVL